MQLVRELLLPYPGRAGFDGVCHLRVYEPAGGVPWVRPVVIVGGLEDSPGTSITNAIEMVAAVIRREIYPRGGAFDLVEHYADRLCDQSRPSFMFVSFKRSERRPRADLWSHLGRLRVSLGEDPFLLASRCPMGSGFREPCWGPIEHAALETLLGCQVRVWPAGGYTAKALAGRDGVRLIDAVAARGSRLRTLPPLESISGEAVA